MPMYNLIEYSDNYDKDIRTVNDSGEIVNFDGTNTTDSFNFKSKVTGQTDNDR